MYLLTCVSTEKKRIVCLDEKRATDIYGNVIVCGSLVSLLAPETITLPYIYALFQPPLVGFET